MAVYSIKKTKIVFEVTKVFKENKRKVKLDFFIILLKKKTEKEKEKEKR